MSGKILQILIVEKDEDQAQLTARLLMRHGYSVFVAHCVAEARESFQKGSPDLIMLDVVYPDGDGILLCSEFHSKADTPIIFLSDKTTTSYKVRGLNAGCDYYLTKPYDKHELLAVIQNLLRRAKKRGDKFAEATLLKRGSLTLNLAESTAYVDDEDIGLTIKEFELLLFLVQNEGRELKYEEIYGKLWKTDMLGSTSTVRKQVSRIKKKLKEENANFAIVNEYGVGYTFVCLDR